MPSQRLLKMMDPLGHLLAPRRVLSPGAPKAVVWAVAARTATWIASELAAVGVEALRASSFRHIDASLRPDARPACGLAVIELATVSESDLALLTKLRWTGFRGPIVAVGDARTLSAETRSIVRIAAVVPIGGPLRDEIARLLQRAPDDDD